MAKNTEFLTKEIRHWRDEGIIDETLFGTLIARYGSPSQANPRTLVRWLLLIGAVSLGVGVVGIATAVLISEGLLSIILVLTGAASLAGGVFLSKRARRPLPKTGGALVVVGCLLLGGAVFTVAKALAPEGDHWSVLFLVVAALYGVVAYATRTPAVLVMMLLALATWFGAETGYVSGWGAYFLGLNYPVRFAVVSPLVILIGVLHRYLPSGYAPFRRVYVSMGLLYWGLSLWILSIWGLGDTVLMGTDDHLVLGALGLLWLGVSVGMLVVGARIDDPMVRGYGVTFIVLNLYTRYYEYFWNGLDKWVFFIVLGLVTLGIGVVIERGLRKSAPGEPADPAPEEPQP